MVFVLRKTGFNPAQTSQVVKNASSWEENNAVEAKLKA